MSDAVPQKPAQSILEDLQSKYEQVETLLKNSASDPPTEPHKSKYAAEVILKETKSLLQDAKNEQIDDYETILGYVYLQLGLIAIDTDELSKGEESLKDCLNLVEKNASSPKNILIVINALNNLGILWSQRSDPNKSFEYLSKAEEFYKDFTANCTEKVLGIAEIINYKKGSNVPPVENISLEKLHTATLQYLAEIHWVLGHEVKSAVYCHETLKRQLESNDYNAIEWALNSATLAQFFLKKSGFTQARNHLAAASYILELYEAELNKQEGSTEELEAKKEVLRYRSADVARCWAKYGLILLSSSKDRLLESEEHPQEDYPDELKVLKFSSIDLSLYESQVTNQYILMFEDARLVFMNVRHWLKKAEEYYTLEDHASDYAQIVQDMSELYKLLAFYEDDESRQCKMHKRQIDCLEELVGKLNPQYYLDICRQVWFELGETYATILYVKEAQLQKENCPNPQSLKKCNNLADQSIKNYSNFINSFKDRSDQLPEKFDDNWERSVLLAHFYIARMLSKIITVDRQLRFDKTKESLNYYKFVVDYAEKHETAAGVVGTELGVARDMVKLLPLKLEKMLGSPDGGS
ncbi:unnamed protein product [Bemisia tabaci]|uniref:KIF-binding protein n=1 Tax=Bemisia tabaci TaxID=7038 RepID=A0A9P0A553_BEMTA|nr:unnamed protein product [Bemisia tabaci]